jgi:hypothetical protein
VDGFRFYEAEVLRLKKLIVSLSPLLTAVNEREGIIHEFQEVTQAANDPQRLVSRGRGLAQQLIKEEKARRRYRNVLPRLEMKLATLLQSYKTEYGVDFEWDGRPYFESLSEAARASIETKPGSKPKSAKPAKTGGEHKTLPPSPRKEGLGQNQNFNPQHAASFRFRPRFHP